MKTKNTSKKIAILLLILAGYFSACDKETSPDLGTATGIIVGSYSNGWIELLVQVDENYPIGKTFERISEDCTTMPENGIFHNMIGIQLLKNVVLNHRISFSYREFCPVKDISLFLLGTGNMFCERPNVPLYVVVSFQRLN
jgi:hypothetical protein